MSTVRTGMCRYCQTLSPDAAPEFTLEQLPSQLGSGVRCVLQLPFACPVRGPIEGPWCTGQRDAKQCVSLLACKLLREAGLLSEHLLPHRRQAAYEIIKVRLRFLALSPRTIVHSYRYIQHSLVVPTRHPAFMCLYYLTYI